MVSSPTMEGLVYNIKLSSVGPGSATSPGLVYEPNGMDLAMKLHYLRGVYYFESPTFEGVDSQGLKGPVFHWLNQFPVPCGRARRDDESGRFYIKCNDCGVRFLEAECGKTMDEWMEMKDANLEKILVPNQSVGPEPQFSPLVLLQFTRFKCGGMAVGLSWAHILGDAFSSAEFMDSLGKHTSSEYRPERPIITAQTNGHNNLLGNAQDPLAIKRVDPVGDKWAYVTDCKMEPFSFEITHAKLRDLQSRLSQNGDVFTPFEVISAVIWKCIAKIRGEELEPNVVTIFKKGEQHEKFGVLSNGQVVNVVKADFPIVGANLSDLAMLVKKDALDERIRVDEAMEKDNGLQDVITYGVNLTFVNFDEAKFYDFKWKGYKPVNVSYWIDGVGEQGTVIVLPGRNDGSKNGGGKAVMTILPKDEVIALKSVLVNEGLIMA